MPGTLTRAVRAERAENPGSTALSMARVRTSKQAPTSSARDTASSATTRDGAGAAVGPAGEGASGGLAQGSAGSPRVSHSTGATANTTPDRSELRMRKRAPGG